MKLCSAFVLIPYSFDLKRKIDPQKAEYKNRYLELDHFLSICQESGGVVQSDGEADQRSKADKNKLPIVFCMIPRTPKNIM